MSTSSTRGFTLLELLVVIALIGTLAAIVLSVLSGAQRDAKDKRRIADIQQIQKALELYHIDHSGYPKESEGANGNIGENEVFQQAIEAYVSGTPLDPINNDTYFYYYDGSHQCGNNVYAVVFARQMENIQNANYDALLAGQCAGVLDGEGRGGGQSSYTAIVGYSSD